MRQSLPRADGLPAGLRERKKLRTRLAIQEHALRLFREQGYRETTVEEIAEAAEVSPSTFFRYFRTKEDVVLFDALDPVMIESFRRQPAELSPIGALRAAFHEIFGGLPAEMIDEQRQRGLLAVNVPELQAAWIAEIIRTSRMMADMLAERIGRSPADARVRMYSGALMGTILAAMVPMLVDADADYVADMDAALDFLEGGLEL
jgi:AcrR family transcriptional regulator